ncbi:tetratricopeptide repeat-containing sensor histidine kinase [Dyadobacter frigoris]|nr:tetratricopeptide repeat-containing sensor histidine kinase [Dyadobacter frigoris]
MAQISHGDSMLTALKKLPQTTNTLANDTVRVELLCLLGSGKDKNGLFQGDYKQCIAWLNEAERLSAHHKWTRGLLEANLNAGVLHAWNGNNLIGLQKIHKAKYYAEQLNRPEYLAKTYRYLADLYYLLGNYDQSIFYLEKALKPAKLTDKVFYIIVIQNLGESYLRKSENRKAMFWLSQAYQESKRIGDNQMLKYTTLNWADACLAAGNKEQLRLLLNEYRTNPFIDKAWDVHYFSLNAQHFLLQNLPHKALVELKKGLSNSETAGEEHRRELFLTLSQVYERLHKSELSLIYYKKYSELWEKGIKSFQQRQTEYLKFEYESLKQGDAIDSLNKDIDGQKASRNRLWLAVALALLFATFLVVNNRVLSKKNRLIEVQRNQMMDFQGQLFASNDKLTRFNEELEQKVSERTEELLLANQELHAKNRQIQEAFTNGKRQERKRVASELHDNLGSTLSGLIWQLQSIMPENLAEKEQDVYTRLITQMHNAYSEIRHISHHLLPLELDNGLEAALSRLFADLNNNSKIRFNLEGRYPSNLLSKEQEAELYSICLELINNTLKHSGSSECTLKLSTSENTLELSLSDNGYGFDMTQGTKRGKGLDNIADRVESLNGKFTVHSRVGLGAQFRVAILQC